MRDGSPSNPALGGQALIEGVMMRSADQWAMACRLPDGTLDVRASRLPSPKGRVRRLPLIRGVVALGTSLSIGGRALQLSAQLQMPEEQRKSVGPLLTGLVAALGLVLGICLFFLLPAFVVDLLRGSLENAVAFVVVEKAVRFGIFFAYLGLISRRRDVQRVFEYHGAEHKVIACREAGEPLSAAAAAGYSRFHPRCGTSFLLLVLAISTVLFSLMGRPDGALLFASRLLGLPLVAGVAYEVLRWLARHEQRPLARAAIAPGLWLQRITTREPDEAQLEVAIAALEAAEAPAFIATVEARSPAAGSLPRAGLLSPPSPSAHPSRG